MGDLNRPSPPIRFGIFEVDLQGGELRKQGFKVKLQEQPFQLLVMLLERPGEIVMREDLQKRLWPADTFVDFERGLNRAVNKLREAIADDADSPRFIETLPRRGYRFLAPVETARPSGSAVAGNQQLRLTPPDLSHRVENSATTVRVSIRQVLPWAAVGVLAIIATIAFWRPWRAPQTADRPFLQWAWWASRQIHASESAKFRRLTFRRGVIQGSRFTPDGRSVIYAASWDGQPLELFSTQLGSPESHALGFPLTGLLSIAANGEVAVCANCRVLPMNSLGTLAQMPLGGGAPREILEGVLFADWAPDGKRMAISIAQDRDRPSRLEFPVGHVLFIAKGTGWPGDPKISPAGDLVAFADHDYRGDDGSVAVVDLQGRKKTLTRTFDTLQGLAWSPSGNEIWFTAAAEGISNRRLYAVTLSGAMREVVQLPANLKLHQIATDGRVLLTKEESRAGVYYQGVGESRARDLSWLHWATAPFLSRDGKTLLMTENDEVTGGKAAIYIRGTDGSAAARLSLGDRTGVSLSPDGKWVVTTVAPRKEADLMLLPVKAGAPVAIETRPLHLTGGTLPPIPVVTWLPDSQRILFSARESEHNVRTFVQDIHGGQPRAVTPEGISGSLLTADAASLLAFDSQSNAFLFPLDGGTPKPLPSLTPEYKALSFSSDGRSLYVAKRSESLPKVCRVDLSTGRIQIWREIPVTDPAGILSVSNIMVTPDGKSLAYSMVSELSELYVVEGLK